MILETIFIWVGGITLISGLLLFLFWILDKLMTTYLKNIGVFWRFIYLSLMISSKNRELYLSETIFESNGKKYKIMDLEELKAKLQEKKA